jgi:hypothetical protein
MPESTIIKMLNFAVDDHVEAKRAYLGMSGVGHDCGLKVFYDFYWATTNQLDVKSLFRIQDGHASEAITARRLSSTPQIMLITKNNNGEQFEFKGIHGHFVGHIDGYIGGTQKWPTVFAVWENKCTKESNFNKLNKLIEKFGMDSALHSWSPIYYVQAQMYMHHSECPRHYTTVTTPGSREYTEIYTEYNEGHAKDFIKFAEIIVTNKIPPPPIHDREIYPCNTCDHAGICHKGELPEVNCRTCIYSEALFANNKGEWMCHLKGETLSSVLMLKGCRDHLYDHHMLSHVATQIDSDCQSVTYEEKGSGEHFKNDASLTGCTSLDLYKQRKANK